MMVPRSYQHASAPLSRSLSDSEKNGITAPRRSMKEGLNKMSDVRQAKPQRMWTIPQATIAQPVVIPTRSQSPRLQNRTKATAAARREEERTRAPYSADPLRPSTAKPLGVTSIPQPRNIMAHRDIGRFERNASSKSLDRIYSANSRQPSSSFSPRSWDLLQSPPSDSDPDSWSLGSDSTVAPLSSFRSLSTDSMPSLDIDLDSPESASHPPTPLHRPRRRGGRLKSLSQSLVEDCGNEHPLSPPEAGLGSDRADGSCQVELEKELETQVVGMLASPSRFSFKSNLTAPLRVLQSAARSFSNMTIQRDEFLTRSILSISPQFTDERRPVLTEEVPDPALRRYLNPAAPSPSGLHFYHHHPLSREANERCTASIQLQTYKKAVTPSKNATVPPVFISSAKKGETDEAQVKAYSPTRQREPRENSDFLRVIVLEMNMRKAGKLNDVAQGKARFWLPPRQLTKQPEPESKGVPRRWSGIVE